MDRMLVLYDMSGHLYQVDDGFGNFPVREHFANDGVA